jgi:hypothetical protein
MANRELMATAIDMLTKVLLYRCVQHNNWPIKADVKKVEIMWWKLKFCPDNRVGRTKMENMDQCTNSNS